MKKVYTISTLLLIAILFNCGGKEEKKGQKDISPIQVQVYEATSNKGNPFLAVSGKIQAVNSADLSTRMMGYVNEVYVHVGDQVKKGELLVSINNSDLQAKRAQVDASILEAKAAYENAKKDYERFQTLYKQQSASQKELDDMTARYQMANARMEAAKQMKNEVNAQFAYVNITAPFEGVVTQKTVKKGDMANPGMPLVTVENPNKFEVIAMVPETEISQITKDSSVEVQVKSLNKTLKGTVSQVSTSAKHTGGQYLVTIQMEASNDIMSGMFVTVQFPVEKKQQSEVVLVPKSALVTKGQLSGIYTVSESQTAILRWVRLGRTYGDMVEVLSGLSIDESYITSSEGKLFNGAKVLVQ